jgi:hypothetical protein
MNLIRHYSARIPGTQLGVRQIIEIFALRSESAFHSGLRCNPFPFGPKASDQLPFRVDPPGPAVEDY